MLLEEDSNLSLPRTLPIPFVVETFALPSVVTFRKLQTAPHECQKRSHNQRKSSIADPRQL